jgi:hypothetical protein
MKLTRCVNGAAQWHSEVARMTGHDVAGLHFSVAIRRIAIPIPRDA